MAGQPELATGVAAAIRVVEDEPFRVRYRLDGNQLRLRDLRVKGVERLSDPEMVVLLTGEYRAADGDIAPPKGPAGVDIYNADPNERMSQLLRESEDLRQAREEFHKFWMNNQPSVHTTSGLADRSAGPGGYRVQSQSAGQIVKGRVGRQIIGTGQLRANPLRPTFPN